MEKFPRAKDVSFPYESPYPVQSDLMDTLLVSLEKSLERKRDRAPVFFLESPTGTGKSLSLASAALAWINHMDEVDLHQEDIEGILPKETNGGDDWLEDWVPPEEQEKLQQTTQAIAARKKAQSQLKSKINHIRSSWSSPHDRRRSILSATLAAKRDSSGRPTKRPKQPPVVEDKDFCLHEYTSDNEEEVKDQQEIGDDDGVVSTTRQLHDVILDPAARGRQLIYAARTHSQLSQFVHELARVDDQVRVVHLGGRSALCGNTSVQRLSTENAVNDACLDLQQKKSTPTANKKKRSDNTTGCPLLSARNTAVPTLALHIQAAPLDIEEVAAIGKQTGTCAYYGSRAAVQTAQVVVLPYSMLLSQKTRKAIGLSLEGALVVVDEAHNLPEAIRSLHASRLTITVVQAAVDQLKAYTTKYGQLLAGRNIFYLGQIRRILIAFQKILRKTKTSSLSTVTDFLIQCKLENINMFRVLRYLERSRLSQKLLGFTNATAIAEETTGGQLSRHVSALSIVETFLDKLTLSGSDGKVVIEPAMNDKPAVLRYVLLSPSIYLDDVLNEAHALALAGGTLRPFVHMAGELLGADEDVVRDAAQADQAMEKSTSFRTPNLTAFSCGHVVPPSHVLLQCWGDGPTRQKLDFRYKSRTTNVVCDELGRCLLSVANEVPNGMVVFLPSYAYESHLVEYWKRTGFWKRLEERKALHREPQSAREVESSLRNFAADADSDRGALLFSVIGGKMSEGINFSDEKARCVLVVGLPYPDINGPELKEKMAALDRSKIISGRQYVHNLCMRAVNQSVGRAIRHAKDYAAIILLDDRYVTDEQVQRHLPSWLRRGNEWKKKDATVSERTSRLSSFFDSFN